VKPIALWPAIPGFTKAKFYRLTTPVDDGEIVQVKDHRQRFLGVGFFNSKSKINVRVLAPERVEINGGFLRNESVLRSLSGKGICQKQPRFVSSMPRAIFLSGLIVDKYEDVLVVQISSLGMDRQKDKVVAALQKIFSPRAIIERKRRCLTEI